MCHRGSHMTRDGTFTVPGDGTVPGAGGWWGQSGAQRAELRDERGAGCACTTATRSGAERSELFRDASLSLTALRDQGKPPGQRTALRGAPGAGGAMGWLGEGLGAAGALVEWSRLSRGCRNAACAGTAHQACRPIGLRRLAPPRRMWCPRGSPPGASTVIGFWYPVRGLGRARLGEDSVETGRIPPQIDGGTGMATKDTGGQRQTTRRTEEVEETESQVNEDVQERHEKLSEDVDAILDEIDEVLEENAEEFVRSYVQKGGQ